MTEYVYTLLRFFHKITSVDGFRSASTPSDCQYYFRLNGASVEGWRQDILALAPDVIFYPSIGMSMLTFALSLLRLEPVQVASSGHPSPSGSRGIDATLLLDCLPKLAAGALPHSLYYHQHPLLPATASAPARAPAHAGIRTICVNAMAAELNADFLETIRQIRQDCGVPTRLVLLPNVHGGEYEGLNARLQGLLGDVQILPSSDFATYLGQLAQADLILQRFPFGGANTTIDGLELGIPVVRLRGDSLFGLIDPMLLEHYGAGQWCADDVPTYARIAIGLLQDGGRARSSGARRGSWRPRGPSLRKEPRRCWAQYCMRSGAWPRRPPEDGRDVAG